MQGNIYGLLEDAVKPLVLSDASSLRQRVIVFLRFKLSSYLGQEESQGFFHA